MSQERAKKYVLNAYLALLEEGYHRPNETIEALEVALGELGASEAQIDKWHNEATGYGLP